MIIVKKDIGHFFTQFGLSSNENVAENAFMVGNSDSDQILTSPSLNEAVDSWMTSPGHRYNLLYYAHTAGAVACYGNKCTFLGLNEKDFGGQCATAAQGKAFFANKLTCSQDQIHQYRQLQQDYDTLGKQYN